jgi:hypothetical protein
VALSAALTKTLPAFTSSRHGCNRTRYHKHQEQRFI